MKKIFIMLMCAVMVCAMPLTVYAAEDEVNLDEAIATTVESTIEATEAVTEETDIVPSEDETIDDVIDTVTTEDVAAWITDNYEELTVIFSVIGAALLIIQRITQVIKSIVTCNNNAVAIAEESQVTTKAALDEVNAVKEIVGAYKDDIAKLLAEVRQSDEEKKILKEALVRVEGFLKTSKLANKELADEMAQLLTLANIPSSVKEELHKRHRAAVDALEAAEAAQNTEVNENVGEES